MRPVLLLTVAIALSFGVLGLVAITLYRPSTAWSAGTVQASTLSGPPVFTLEELRAANVAMTDGTPLPPGWGLEHDEGTVQVVDAGKLGSGKDWVVTVRAQPQDLVSATAYVNGSAVKTATRENGGIVDRAEDAVATLVVPVPAIAWAGKVEWVGADGTVRSSSRGPPEFVLRLKRAWDAALDRLSR